MLTHVSLKHVAQTTYGASTLDLTVKIATDTSDAMNEKFRKVDTQIHGIFYGAIYRDLCTHASNICKFYSRVDQIKRIWALNKIRNTFSS